MDALDPFFSIIIPTYARPERLAACLAALTRLDYPRDRFEVIVVDDGSPAPAAPVVAALAGRLPVILLARPHAGPAAARNAGAARARGDYLAFTDDDCAPDPGWLRALAAQCVATPGAAIGGRTVNALPANPYAAASQLLIDYLYGYYNAGSEGARFYASNNLALPAGRFHGLGGFDTGFPLAGEDRDLCDRWRGAGYPMADAPGAIVRHAHPLTLRRFWRQHLNYGRGAFRFHEARGRRDGQPLRVEPSAFYLGLLRCPFAHTGGRRAPLLMALLIVTQVANVTGFALERAQAGRRR